MKKTIISILILTLLLGLCAGCGSNDDVSILSQEKANKIALGELGLSSKDVDDSHIHVGTYESAPCYSVHITAGKLEYEVIVHAVTGEVLYVGNATH